MINILISLIFLFLIFPLGVEAKPVSSPGTSNHFVVSPSIGYSAGTLKQNGVADIGTQILAAELLVGYRYSDVTLGLSYLNGLGLGEQYGNKSDISRSELSVQAMYTFLTDFNFFGVYIFDAKTKIQKSENPGDFSGRGTKLGFSYALLHWASIAIELQSRTYNKYNGTDLSKSITDSSTGVSFIFPLL